MESQAPMQFAGTLAGHNDWVTSIATPSCDSGGDIVVSSSRDHHLILWKLTAPTADSDSIGYAQKRLTGHSQCIQDIAMSMDGKYALTASWDKQVRLWDLNRATSVRKFVGHTSDVNSVTFSSDNRQIVSGSRDRTIKLWNTMGDCKYTLIEDQHTDWVSCVRFSPHVKSPIIVSCGWDKMVKVWDLKECRRVEDLEGHTGVLNSVTISPDGSLCASGGKDGVAMLWDVNEGKRLYSLEAGASINQLCFSPCNYWLCAATEKSIKIWDLESKKVLCEVNPVQKFKSSYFVCLTWSSDGRTLFCGSTDGNIYVFKHVS